MMNFRTEITNNAAWLVTTDICTELVPADIVPQEPSPEDFKDFVAGSQVHAFEKREGWFAVMSAPGCVDAARWRGPFSSKLEAVDHLHELREELREVRGED